MLVVACDVSKHVSPTRRQSKERQGAPHGSEPRWRPGFGSSARAVSTIGDTFLHFLQGLQRSLDATRPQPLSILDVGCGWGEWLPSMLTKAVKERSLHENLVYFGIDIAEKPIAFLRRSMGGHAFQFEATWHPPGGDTGINMDHARVA